MNRPAVLCLGVLVADIFVPPLERLPEPGELLATGEFLVQPGGCAANVALALGTLGHSSSVSGRVGDDMFGEMLVRRLNARAIDTSSVVRSIDAHTSTTVILPVVGDDRRYIHTFGANAKFSAADVGEDVLAAARVIYVGGYLLLPALEQAPLAALLQRARARGTIVVFDVAVPAGSELALPALSSLLPLTDYFVPNYDEARAITGESDVSRQADRLMAFGAPRVLIKQGNRGTYVRDSGHEFQMPAPVLDVVDHSGAGDAFAAGLILGIRERWDLERMVRFANVAGASACTTLGAWNGVFNRAQTDDFLQHHPLPSKSALAA